MSKERHITVYTHNGAYHFRRLRARDAMPWDGRGNPWLWFGNRHQCEMEVCGVNTLREAKAHFGLA